MFNIKKSKAPSPIFVILSSILIIFSYLIISGNTGNHDYPEYLSNYNGVLFSSFEFGYSFISEFFFHSGVSFNIFKSIIYFFVYIFIYHSYFKFFDLKVILFFTIMYFIFPLAFDASALRNTISLSIIILGFPLLISRNFIKNIYFILFVIMASFFHSTSIFYIIFLLPKFFNKSYYKNYYFRVFLLTFALLFILLSLNDFLFSFFINSISSILLNFKLIDNTHLIYFEIRGRYGFIAYGIIHLIFLYLNVLVKNDLRNKANVKLYHLSLVEFMLDINIVYLFLIPIYRLNSNFFRLFQNITILQYFVILVFFTYFTNYKKNSNYKIIIFLAIFVISYSFGLIFIQEWEFLISTLFKDNWYFSNL